MYILGDNTTQEIVFISGRYPTGDPSDENIINNAVTTYGGTSAIYSVYHVDEKSDDYNRIKNKKAEPELVWDGTTITGIVFTEYDTRQYIGVITDKTIIDPDGIDTAVLTITVYENDGVSVDTKFNSTVNFQMLMPTGGYQTVQISFNKGIATYDFTTTVSGTWKFPPDEHNFNELVRVVDGGQAIVRTRIEF